MAGALAAAGVAVDSELALLLQGYPARYLRACYTETWVASLYQRLTASAPWRFLACTPSGSRSADRRSRWTAQPKLSRALWERSADLDAALLRL